MAPYKYTETKNPDTFLFSFANRNTTAVCMNLVKILIGPNIDEIWPAIAGTSLQLVHFARARQTGFMERVGGCTLEDKRFGHQETYSNHYETQL